MRTPLSLLGEHVKASLLGLMVAHNANKHPVVAGGKRGKDRKPTALCAVGCAPARRRPLRGEGRIRRKDRWTDRRIRLVRLNGSH